MKYMIQFTLTLLFGLQLHAGNIDTIADLEKAAKILKSSAEVTSHITEKKNDGFSLYGLIDGGIKAFCDCKYYELIFQKYDYSQPKNANGRYDPVVVKTMVQVEDFSTENPLVSILGLPAEWR